MRRWFYFAQEDIIDGNATLTAWRGTNELLRLSSVILRQRRFALGPIRFFYGRTEVDLELIWRWAR